MTPWFSYWLSMPRPLTLRPMECPASDLRWVPEEATLQVCYRMLVRLAGVLSAADSTRSAWAPAVYYFLLHGMAHAIVDELDLPTPSGEERTVDEVMALMLIPAGGDRASTILLAVRTLQGADARWDTWEHARTHQLGPERLETVACLAYGANPSAFPEFRTPDCVKTPCRRLSLQRARAATWSAHGLQERSGPGPADPVSGNAE
jgi:hypothetical protein